MTEETRTKLEELLVAAYRRMHPEGRDREHEFVFHMVDAAEDLRAYAKLTEDPDRVSEEEAAQIVRGVLYHAVGHLVAAARLHDTFVDTFGAATRADEQT